MISILVWVVLVYTIWPGWASEDSLDQWLQAVNERPISDWHTPLLSWLWGVFGAKYFGPIIPILLQTGAFVFGIFLISKAQAKNQIRSMLIYIAFFLAFPVFWSIGWIWKDSFQLATLILATGLLLAITSDTKRTYIYGALIVVVLLVSASSVVRIYMVPLIAAWTIAIASISKLEIGRRGLVSLFMVIMTLGIVLNNASEILLKPTKTYPESSTQLLDLARIECGQRPIGNVTPEDGAIPRNKISNGSNADICKHFSPYTWDPLAWGSRYYPPHVAEVDTPTSPAEAFELTERWKAYVVLNSNMLVKSRFAQLNAILFSSRNEQAPPRETPISSLAGVAIAEGWSWVRINNDDFHASVLRAAAEPGNRLASVAPNLVSPFVLIVILPLIGFIAFVRQDTRLQNGRRTVPRLPPIAYIFLSIIPLAWSSVMALLAPAYDTRYSLVPCFMGLTVFILHFDLQKNSNDVTDSVLP